MRGSGARAGHTVPAPLPQILMAAAVPPGRAAMQGGRFGGSRKDMLSARRLLG